MTTPVLPVTLLTVLTLVVALSSTAYATDDHETLTVDSLLMPTNATNSTETVLTDDDRRDLEEQYYGGTGCNYRKLYQRELYKVSR